MYRQNQYKFHSLVRFNYSFLFFINYLEPKPSPPPPPPKPSLSPPKSNPKLEKMINDNRNESELNWNRQGLTDDDMAKHRILSVKKTIK